MSALGQKRTCAEHQLMWPIADITPRTKILIDQLVGAGEQGGWHCEAKGFGSLMIDHQLVLCRRLYRQIGRFLSLQYSIHIASSAIRMSALAPKAGIGTKIKATRIQCCFSITKADRSCIV